MEGGMMTQKCIKRTALLAGLKSRGSGSLGIAVQRIELFATARSKED